MRVWPDLALFLAGQAGKRPGGQGRLARVDFCGRPDFKKLFWGEFLILTIAEEIEAIYGRRRQKAKNAVRGFASKAEIGGVF
ncbi:MAG: hypothetical protein LBJ64_04760 [Deltaproteobacteria bacterium]|jgi:hypothetical protein|nr:hypothetical protein [Deltaproteobacteria bacterium]